MQTGARNDGRIKIRANRTTGELEVEGPSHLVSEWWERFSPTFGKATELVTSPVSDALQQGPPRATRLGQFPELFGEFFTAFGSVLSDVDKVLVAAAFAQDKENEQVFTTKAANQLLLEQGIKVSNPSECVRRLAHAKRVFVVSVGKFRVSATGREYLESLKDGA